MKLTVRFEIFKDAQNLARRFTVVSLAFWRFYWEYPSKEKIPLTLSNA